MNDEELVSELEQKSDPAADKRAEGIPENAGFWWKLIHLDPAILRGSVVSIMGLAAAFGYLVNDQRQGAILGAIAAVLALAQALWTRRAVTPNAKVVVYKPNPVEEPEILLAGHAISTNVVAVANAAADDVDGERNVQDLPFPEKVEQ